MVTESDFILNAELIVRQGSSFHPQVETSAPDGPTYIVLMEESDEGGYTK